MNLILHQFKTDVRHFRWSLLALWLSFAAVPLLLGLNLVSGQGVAVVDGVVTLWQVLLAVFLVAQLVQADPLVGSSAAWLTRPVRRAHLFWAKSAFMLVCLLVPRLVAQSVIWLLRDYTAHQMICAALEALLFSGAIVAVTAVLAAVTRDLPRFFLAVGIAVGVMFAWVVVVEMLKRAGWIHEAAAIWNESASLDLSRTVLAVAIIGGGATLGWLAQGRAGLRWVGVTLLAAGLLVSPLIVVLRINILKPRLVPSVPLTLSVWQTNLPAAGEGSQQLYSELIVNGVPTQHVAVAQTLNALILFQGEHRVTVIPRLPYSSTGGRPRPADSEQNQNYFRLLRDFFPAQTLWFDSDNRGGIGMAFYEEQMMKRFTNRPPAGKLSGSAELDLYAVKKVVEAPVRPGRHTIRPGWSVSIQQVKFTGDTITVVVDEGTPGLILNRDDVGANSYLHGGVSPYCTYVLYHPGSGEAYQVEQRNSVNFYRSILSSESHIQFRLRFPYPALREKFAGVTAAEWLREARLVVFVPVYAGTAKLDFHKDDYVWPVNFNNTAQEKKSLADREAIAQAALPPDPTAAQVDAYLDTLCQNVPDYSEGDFHKLIEDKFIAIGTNGLTALIRRLPLDPSLEQSFVLPTLRKLATRAHLPELLAALRRDYGVAIVFVEKHWEVEARPVLINKLKDRTRPAPAEALRIVADAKDPQNYEDLRRRFLHLDSDQHLVIPALEQSPGLDVAALVREAWARSRMGLINGNGLAVAAAKQGLPDALTTAIVTMEKSGSKSWKQSELAQLAELTGYTGAATNTLAWLGANLADFQFDATQQRYVLQRKH